MNLRNDASMGALLLGLVVGAAAGALLVLLNTNKPDLERARQAKALARCAKRGSEAVAEDSEGILEDWQARQSGLGAAPNGA